MILISVWRRAEGRWVGTRDYIEDLIATFNINILLIILIMMMMAHQERSRYVLVLDRGSRMEGGGKWKSLHHALHR